MLGEHLAVDVVLAQFLGESFAAFLAFDRRRGRLIGGHNGAFSGKRGAAEHPEQPAGGVDAVGDEQGVAVAALEAALGFHVEHDVGDDLAQAVLGARHRPHRAPALFELGFGEIGQGRGLGLEPLVDLGLGSELLVDVPGFVAQVEHDFVAHRLVVFVGMDVRPENLDAAGLVGFEQGSAGEADQRCFGQQRLHRPVQLARLGAVAFVDEDENLAFGLEVPRQVVADFLDVLIDFPGAGFLARAELVNQRGHQPVPGGLQRAGEVGAAAGAVDGLVNALEDFLDLLVKLLAVGDDQHPPAGDVFPDPLRQPDHQQAFAAALGVPDDAALAAGDMPAGGDRAEVLVVAAGFLHTGVEHHEVVDDFKQPIPAAKLAEFAQQLVPAGFGTRLGFLPSQPVLFRGFDEAVAQAFGLVARHQQLQRGEEGLDEFRFLVVEVLADAFSRGDGRALQFNHAEGDAVDIEHHIGAFVVHARYGDFLGDGEVVVLRIFPIDQPDRLGLLAGCRRRFHAIAEQAVDFAVGVVEGLGAADGRGALQFVDGFADDAFAMALQPQPLREEVRFDIGIARAVDPVAEVAVAERALEKPHHPPLGLNLALADFAHSPAPSLPWFALAARPFSASRYFCSRLRSFSDSVYSISCSFTSCRTTSLSCPDTVFWPRFFDSSVFDIGTLFNSSSTLAAMADALGDAAARHFNARQRQV